MTRAVELLSLSVVLQLGVDELEGRGLSSALSSPSGMAENLLRLGVASVMIVGIARGRRWARILFLISCILVSVAFVVLAAAYALGTVRPLTPLQGLSVIVQTILSTATAYLLFTEPARSWFAREEESP